MMGRLERDQERLFYEYRLDDLVPADHRVRKVDAVLDLSWLRAELAPYYSHTGRPSIDPELMLRMLIVGYVFAIRSERRLCSELQVNMAYRWFCGLSIESTIPDHSVFSRARHERFREGDILRRLFERVVGTCIVEGLVGGEAFSVDASLIQADVNPAKRVGGDEPIAWPEREKASRAVRDFLATILPYTNAEWEKLSIFLNFLVAKLPAPVEEDLSKGILEAIDMDSYRVEKQAVQQIQLPDADAEIEPVPTSGGGGKAEPELDRLSNILKTFNEQFGNIRWADEDRVRKLITEDIPNRVAADTAYQNAKKQRDKQIARIEHDKALKRVMTGLLKDDTELFKQFVDNEGFRRWMTDAVFGLTYDQPTAP